jgi:hypothetical protein
MRPSASRRITKLVSTMAHLIGPTEVHVRVGAARVGAGGPRPGSGGGPEPPVGAFRGSFRRNLGEIRGVGGQKRLRNARERIQETLGARRPLPPVDRAGVHGSRRRPRGQRARGCVRDRPGSGGVPKRLFRGPGEQNFRDRIGIRAGPRHNA